MPKASQKERFTSLLSDQGGRLHKVALAYSSTNADREDLKQEILVQLWRSFDRFDESRPFGTWMYRIALNVAISHLRRVSRRPKEIAEQAERTFDPPDPRSLPQGMDERMHMLQGMLTSLDELDRALLLLHLEDRSYREIADVLGLSDSNVGTKLNRLKQRLRGQAELATGPTGEE